MKVWVILDRPPNDPLLRKKEPFTSSKPSKDFGRASFGGRFSSQKELGQQMGINVGLFQPAAE